MNEFEDNEFDDLERQDGYHESKNILIVGFIQKDEVEESEISKYH